MLLGGPLPKNHLVLVASQKSPADAEGKARDHEELLYDSWNRTNSMWTWVDYWIGREVQVEKVWQRMNNRIFSFSCICGSKLVRLSLIIIYERNKLSIVFIPKSSQNLNHHFRPPSTVKPYLSFH